MKDWHHDLRHIYVEGTSTDSNKPTKCLQLQSYTLISILCGEIPLPLSKQA